VTLIGVLLVGFVMASYTALRAPESEAIPRLPPPITRDLDEILQRDTLFALTSYSSTSYFLYRGEPFGFEYELLRDFGETHDVVVKMLVVPRDSLLPMLNRGVGDVAAASLIPSEQDTAYFRYTEELYRTRPMVVQREGGPDSARVATGRGSIPSDTSVLPRSLDTTLVREVLAVPEPFRIAARPIQRPADLRGRDVHVQRDHPYVDQLVELEDAVTGEIHVVEVDTTTESLIRQVAGGAIDYVVAPENMAELEQSYYTNLTVNPTVGPSHPVTWAVRGNSPRLREAMNAWIINRRDTDEFERLYAKYFVDRQAFRQRVESRYLTGETRVLSAFDNLLRRAAATIGWDWRLLASQAYQESRFDPAATSWAGAMGLLQLMPATARDLGVADAYDAEENALAAVRYLRWLEEEYWNDEIADVHERLKFVLASYNAGAGHVMDARRLAEAEGGDPDLWEDVAYWLLQKSRVDVYNRPEVRHGFCRGLEPVQYVARILDRFDHYRQFVPGPEDAPPVAPAAARPATRPAAAAAAP
jgi:membrane-bound lytic murein transglycosylase F